MALGSIHLSTLPLKQPLWLENNPHLQKAEGFFSTACATFRRPPHIQSYSCNRSSLVFPFIVLQNHGSLQLVSRNGTNPEVQEPFNDSHQTGPPMSSTDQKPEAAHDDNDPGTNSESDENLKSPSIDLKTEPGMNEEEKMRHFANVRERERIRAINDHFDEIRELVSRSASVPMTSRSGRKSRRKKLSKLDTLSVVIESIQRMRNELSAKHARVISLKNNLRVHFEDDHFPNPKCLGDRPPKICQCGNFTSHSQGQNLHTSGGSLPSLPRALAGQNQAQTYLTAPSMASLPMQHLPLAASQPFATQPPQATFPQIYASGLQTAGNNQTGLRNAQNSSGGYQLPLCNTMPGYGSAGVRGLPTQSISPHESTSSNFNQQRHPLTSMAGSNFTGMSGDDAPSLAPHWAPPLTSPGMSFPHFSGNYPHSFTQLVQGAAPQSSVSSNFQKITSGIVRCVEY